MTLTRTRLAALAALIGAGLAACSPSPSASPPVSARPTASATPSPSTTTTPSRTTDQPEPDPSPSPNGLQPGRIGGAAVALPGGVSVKVGNPKRYPTTNLPIATRAGNTLAVYPVTVTDTSTRPVDMTLTAVDAYARGEQVELISDSEHPADNHFSGTLLPGRTMRATYSLLVRETDAGQMQIEVFVPTVVQSHGIFIDSDGTT